MSDPTALGKHEVDMSVYAKVAAHETLNQEGVVHLTSGFTEKIGMSKTPGITTRLDDDGRLQIDISVVVNYGTDLRRLGPTIQDAVLSGIHRMSDQPVGQINVFIADIEFPKQEQELSKREERQEGDGQ